MPKRLQHIKVKDYGEEWVNRLAVVEDQFSKMGAVEKGATLQWLISKYGQQSEEG